MTGHLRPDNPPPGIVSAPGLAESLKELLWPTRCLTCDYPGELLCADCRAALPWIDQRWACPICGAPFGSLTCTECKRDWPLRTCVCALVFAGTAARMATGLKESHELRLAPVIAAAVATALDEAAGWPAPDGSPRYDQGALDAVCFVPATHEAYVRRGFDHMELVAHELSCLLELPLADVLVRAPARDQRNLGRRGRMDNLAGTVEVVEDVSGLRLLLADDVVTTGSSMCTCASALLERGAQSVTGCALARVW